MHLCRPTQVRAAGCDVLQRAAVAAERMCVAPGAVEAALSLHVLPAARTMVKRIGARDAPGADAAARELLNTTSKMVLLFTHQIKVRAACIPGAALSA